MSELARFGVSMEGALLERFDELIARKGYANRSEAVRDLVRAALVESDWQGGDAPTMAAVSLVYDHHIHDLSHKLTHIQHDHRDNIVSALHVHLDDVNCPEIIVLKGKGRDIKALADRLIAAKGVKHGRLMMATDGRGL
jgi:CopG family nickel-responsive transcriptional regulator